MADVAGALTQPQAELRMRSMVGDAGFAVARPRSPKPHQRFAIGILSDGCWKEFCFGESFEGAFAKWNAGIRFDHNAAQTHREIELPNIVDLNRALDDLRNLIRALDGDDSQRTRSRVRELFRILDGHLLTGSLLPRDWSKAGKQLSTET